MKSFELKFSGNENENAEHFLKELLECIDNSRIDKKAALKAVSRLLHGNATKWYDGERAYIKSWKDFEKKFKCQFIPHRKDDDLWDDLYGRTQGKNEKIADYVNNIKYIAGFFKKTPSEEKLVSRARKNLLPEYRTFMRDKKIKTFDKLQKYGQEFEREQEYTNRYTPPRTKDLMTIKSAAYKLKDKEKEKKNSATSISEIAVTAEITETPKKSKKNKQKTDKKEKEETAAVTTPTVPAATQATPSTSTTTHRPFNGTCRLCNEYGHRAFHCPKRDGRVVCWGCARFDVKYNECEPCQERKRQGNETQGSRSSFPSAQYK